MARNDSLHVLEKCTNMIEGIGLAIYKTQLRNFCTNRKSGHVKCQRHRVILKVLQEVSPVYLNKLDLGSALWHGLGPSLRFKFKYNLLKALMSQGKTRNDAGGFISMCSVVQWESDRIGPPGHFLLETSDRIIIGFQRSHCIMHLSGQPRSPKNRSSSRACYSNRVPGTWNWVWPYFQSSFLTFKKK